MKGIITAKSEEGIVFIKATNSNEIAVGVEVDVNIAVATPKEKEKLVFNFDNGYGEYVVVKITPEQLKFLEELSSITRNEDIPFGDWEEGYPTDEIYDFTNL